MTVPAAAVVLPVVLLVVFPPPPQPARRAAATSKKAAAGRALVRDKAEVSREPRPRLHRRPGLVPERRCSSENVSALLLLDRERFHAVAIRRLVAPVAGVVNL